MAERSRRTARGKRTRDRLVDVAEQLMAARGIEAVSLREIRLAAGQGNTSAMQFHFGDRHGLLRAITERHRPRVAARLSRLRGLMLDEGRDDDCSLVEVLVRPVAEYVFEGPSARAWVCIGAELASRPQLGVADFVAGSSPESVEVAGELLKRLEPDLSRRVAVDRIVMMMLAHLHICADRARAEQPGVAGGRRQSCEEFVNEVVAMSHAALFAPARASADEATGRAVPNAV